MNRGARMAFAILSFGAYVVGLVLAGVSGFLTVAIGPFDGFAATMIVVPGAIGLAGGAGIVRVAGRPRRGRAILALAIGAAWVAATVGILAIYASIGR